MTRTGAPVLLVANNFPPVRGGSASVYANLARNAGRRIEVLAPRVGYTDGLILIGWRENDRHACYPVRRLPLLRTIITETPAHGSKRLQFIARDLLIRFRVGLAVLHAIAFRGVRTICIGELLASSWMLQMLRWLPGVRKIAYVHGEEITTALDSPPLRMRSRTALARSDIIIVVSRFTERTVADLIGDDAAAKIRLIENGVDNERFSRGPKSPSLLTLYGIEGSFVFVSVCRLLAKKGIDHAILAFARLLDRYPDSRYLVVGTGPYRPTLEALVDQHGLRGKVIFAGQVGEDELVEHYRLGDVFVMPNRRMPDGDTEGFGLVFLEANACGLPVIAGQDGGSTDAVTDMTNGLVVDGHSIEAIAEAMLRVRSDAALYARLHAGALETAARAGWSRKTADFLANCI